MDLDLHDFSGIQNEDSQFLDESNLNVFNQQSANRRPRQSQADDQVCAQLEEQPPEQQDSLPLSQQPAGLQELNLLEMSCISMAAGDQSVMNDKNKEEIFSENPGNESMVQTALLMMQEAPQASKALPVHFQKPPLMPVAPRRHEDKPPVHQDQLNEFQGWPEDNPDKTGTNAKSEEQKAWQPEPSQHAIDHQVNEKTDVPSSSSEWKKITIPKKKRFSKKDQTKLSQDTLQVPVVPQQSQNPDSKDLNNIDLDDINLDFGLLEQKSAAIRKYPANPQPIILSKAESKNKYATEAEPLPLFDCLYCVGIHEHLILQTLKEKQLNNLYGKDLSLRELTLTQHDQTQEEFNIEFKRNVKFLQRYFAIQSLEVKVHKSIDDSSRSDEDQKCHQQPSSTILGLNDFKFAVESQCQKSNQSLKPPTMKRLISQRQRQLTAYRATQVQEPQEQTPKEKKEQSPQRKKRTVKHELSSLDSEDELDPQLVSNILGGFDDIDSDEQSMFINLNIRNRRQKVLFNISFETEAFDIYNPDFSSQESSDTDSETVSSVESSEQVNNEGFSSQSESSNRCDSSQGSSSSSFSTNSMSSRPSINSREKQKMFSTTSYDQLQDSKEEQRTIELKKGQTNQTKLKEQDLDFNSENNRSSLSSIHREIQDAPTPSMDRGEQLMSSRHDEMETGGCQVEEMQNDTVVNKCKFLLATKGGLDKNDSFSMQIRLKQQEALSNQLNKLEIYPDAIQESPFDQELDNRSDLEETSVEEPQQFLEMADADNYFTAATSKKATGHFQNQLAFPSEESNKMLTAKKYLNTKLESESQQIYMTQQNKHSASGHQQHPNFVEDDSIIKIMPGMPGGKHIAELTPFEAEESEIKQGDSLEAPKREAQDTKKGKAIQVKPNQVKLEAKRRVKHNKGVKSVKQDEALMGQNAHQLQEDGKIADELYFQRQAVETRVLQSQGGHHYRATQKQKEILSSIVKDQGSNLINIQIRTDNAAEAEQLYIRKMISKSKIASPTHGDNMLADQVREAQKISNSASRQHRKEATGELMKNATQKLGLRNQLNKDNRQFQKSANQASNPRKRAVEQPVNDFYTQKGKVANKRNSTQSKTSNNQHSRAVSNANKKMHDKKTSATASMGALPLVQNNLVANARKAELMVNYIAKSESQPQLTKDGELATGSKKSEHGYIVKSKSKQKLPSGPKLETKLDIRMEVLNTATTPVKSKNLLSIGASLAQGTKSAAQNSKMQAKQGIKQGADMHEPTKHSRHNHGSGSQVNPEQIIAQKQVLIDQFTGKSSHGMLSKQQLKLMKQLQKQQSYAQIANSETSKKTEPPLSMADSNPKDFILQGDSLKSTIQQPQLVQPKRNPQNVLRKSAEQSLTPSNNRLTQISSPLEMDMHTVDAAKQHRYVTKKKKNKSSLKSGVLEVDLIEKVQAEVPAQKTKAKKAELVEKDNRQHTALSPQHKVISKKSSQSRPQLEIVAAKINEHKIVEQDKKMIKMKTQNLKFKSVQQTAAKSKPLGSQAGTIKASTYSTKDQVKDHASQLEANRRSLLYQSSSLHNQLDLFDEITSNVNKKPKKQMMHLPIQNLESNIFSDDNLVHMPAQSHRTRVSKNQLSISADKTPKVKELMKSSVELQHNNYSQIQGRDQSELSKIGATTLNKIEVSKASIERDIKLIKLMKKPVKDFENQESKATTTKQNSRLLKMAKNRLSNLQPVLQGSHPSSTKEGQLIELKRDCTIDKAQTAKQSDQKPSEQRVKGDTRMTMVQPKPCKLSLNTVTKPEYQRNSNILSGATTSKSSKIPAKLEAQERTSTIHVSHAVVLEDHEQIRPTLNPPRHTTKADDYKMQILENNKKILKFESTKDKSGAGLQKGSKFSGLNPGHHPTKQSFSSNKNPSEMLRPSLQAFNTLNKQSQQAKMQAATSQSNFASVHANPSTEPLSQALPKQGKGPQYFELFKKQMSMKSHQPRVGEQAQAEGQRLELGKADYFKTNGDNNEGNIAQTSDILANIVNSSSQINNSNSLLAPSLLQGKQAANVSNALQKTGVTGLGQTTFINKSNNANTTASSNTLSNIQPRPGLLSNLRRNPLKF